MYAVYRFIGPMLLQTFGRHTWRMPWDMSYNMKPATEYFGLLNKNGSWLLSESARRNLQL
eukprot:6972570-Prorocentrum_lima.AAC.1